MVTDLQALCPHLEISENTVNFIVDGKPFIALAGELHNSTSSSLSYINKFWDKLSDMHLNTVIFGLSWELIEPTEGFFDFSLIDALIDAAYLHNLKIIPIWFATWKNASSTYTPEWVQSDLKRFPRAIHKDGKRNSAISCFSTECCDLDARAFSKLMQHIKEIDIHKTVIAVQVENESGILSSSRDFSPLANKFFEENIPCELADRLNANKSDLSEYLLQNINFDLLSKTWKDGFNRAADEAFMCYYTAKYINKIVKAGKAEYSIPMFVNAWTQQCENEIAGAHPSGGATSQMLDIWRCAAPDIDIFAGDLYLENIAPECAAYRRLKGNPLFIPEARKDKWVMSHAFFAIGNYDALCFAPFGIENIETENVLPKDMVIQSVFQSMSGGDTSLLVKQTYQILNNMMEIICKYRGTGKMKGILQNRMMHDSLIFSEYSFKVSYKNFVDMVDIPGGGLIIELSQNQFIAAGANFSLDSIAGNDLHQDVEILALEEGHFNGLEWVCDRRLNGDELHLWLNGSPRIIKFKLLSI